MYGVNVKGKIKEICWQSDKCCRFIVDDGEGGLVCTITKSKLKLANKIAVGKEYNFIGDIRVFKKHRDDTTYIENTFYIIDIKENM